MSTIRTWAMGPYGAISAAPPETGKDNPRVVLLGPTPNPAIVQGRALLLVLREAVDYALEADKEVPGSALPPGWIIDGAHSRGLRLRNADDTVVLHPDESTRAALRFLSAAAAQLKGGA